MLFQGLLLTSGWIRNFALSGLHPFF